MANMIPVEGNEFDIKSKEKEMFDALKTLSNDYYIFHSYRITSLTERGLNENEIDFLVFNPYYGCLFLECKNRTLRKNNQKWEYLQTYNSGQQKWVEMPVDPFTQAFTGQHMLFKKLKEQNKSNREMIDIINRCKFMVAIWLPKYSRKDIEENIIGIGPEATPETILTADELKNTNMLAYRIEELMKRMNRVHFVCHFEQIIDDAAGYRQNANYQESMLFFNKILNPSFNIICDARQGFEKRYLQLLEEQCIVLDFLSYQRTAAISGASGTGKTLVAIERARRLNRQGFRVLFLCYNKNLQVVLHNSYHTELPKVDFYTLDKYAMDKCKTTFDKINYSDLYDVLEEEIDNGTFEYQHIIVDEGQDFGQSQYNDNVDASYILELFASYGTNGGRSAGTQNTSFFVFYDKNQLVNTKDIPEYLRCVDSKLTLYTNCRNTKKIADTAYCLIDEKPISNKDASIGSDPQVCFFSTHQEFKEKLNKLISDLSKETINDIVLITCASGITVSEIKEHERKKVENNYFYRTSDGREIRLYTSATFKGLEADNVIVLDITDDTFSPQNKTFYVAASRAKINLYCFIDRNKVNISNILQRRFSQLKKNKSNEYTRLAIALKASLLPTR